MYLEKPFPMLDLITTKPNLRDDDILVVGVVRNELLRLPYFLQHHRSLGVNRFFLIDNDSDDRTVEFLSSQADVHLFHTSGRYSESMCGVTWLNQILQDYAVGHWTLILDADELFIFPGTETISFTVFLSYLEMQGAEAVVAPLLDMYSGQSLAQTGYKGGEDLLTTCPYFDAEGYEFTGPKDPGPSVIKRGGPRKRMFWDGFDRPYPAPFLNKIPLAKWREDLALEASTHVLEGVKLAGVTGMLLHFKFLQDFAWTAAREIERKEHFRGAMQYEAYNDILSSNPDLSAFWEGSVRFRNSWQLVELGLIQVPNDYIFREIRHGKKPGQAQNDHV